MKASGQFQAPVALPTGKEEARWAPEKVWTR